MAPDPLPQIRCQGCGRFIGKGSVKAGLVLLYCGKCKRWTVVCGEEEEKDLTGEEIYAMIAER